MNFMDLKLTLWLISRSKENKNKENKHTWNRVDGGFDKKLYYKQKERYKPINNNGERKNWLEY